LHGCGNLQGCAFLFSTFLNSLCLFLVGVIVYKIFVLASLVAFQAFAEFGQNDVADKGNLSPTLYNHPFIIDEGSCAKGLAPIRGTGGKNLMMVCKTTISKCALEGSCEVERDGEVRAFNYLNSPLGYPVFIEITDEECFHGFGVKNICLDPFYTVAADLNFHKAGDVIYVPKVKGTVLPNGEIHDGFFVVRDRGGAIKGQHRFDFFTGSYDWHDPQNPFKKLGLSDVNAKFQYYKLKESAASQVRGRRGYPGLIR
jgi:3D (Asp-Asp-Asp) domain-containing protein